MKQLSLILIIISAFSFTAFAQWTDTGTKSYTNDQIGIGISDPGSYILNVNGNTFNNGTQYFRTVDYNGLTSQTHLAFPVATDGFFLLTRQLAADRMEVLFQLRDNTTGDAFKIWFDDYRGATYDRYPFIVYGNKVLLASDGGNVGIGIDTPENKLDVAGTIRAEEVKVETGWADYVFFEDYDLKSLDEVSTFITKNGHLPNIPTAKEVKENGIKLGEMNAKLLEKVEELTLYLIEKDREIERLQKRDQQLIERIEKLENKQRL